MDLQKAVSDISGIPVQVQRDERSLRHRNPPRVKPDAVGRPQPNILRFEFALQVPKSARMFERIKWSASRSQREDAEADRRGKRSADIPRNLHAQPDYTYGMGQWRRTGMIRHISAVTFAVHDMARSIEFYKKLGFELSYGDDRAEFSSMKAGEAFVNLSADPRYEHRWWGRAIFRVDDVDGLHRALTAAGLQSESPRDAAWGERFFHITDPDGNELSFAELLQARS